MIFYVWQSDPDYSLSSACSESEISLDHDACLQTTSTCLVCLVHTCSGVVARHYSIVYKNREKTSTGRPPWAAIGEEHSNQQYCLTTNVKGGRESTNTKTGCSKLTMKKGTWTIFFI